MQVRDRSGHAVRRPSVLQLSLLLLAALFTGATVYSIWAPGSRLQIGPARVSMADSSRVAFQTSLVWIVAATAWSFGRHRRVALTIAVGVVLAAAIADSFPRRVGDGAEYMAMALNLARGAPPSVSSEDKARIHATLATASGFEESPVDFPLVAPDGRQEFPHFWLFPLAVAPLMAVTSTLGLHPNAAFTLFNFVLVLAFVWLIAGRGEHLLAVVFASGPLTWWVDKAHAEVFLSVLIAAAVFLRKSNYPLAAAAAGIATAQNPAAGGLLAVLTIELLTRKDNPRWHYVAMSGALAFAALNPAYYLIRIGRVSPLLESNGAVLPGFRALLTPLVDPNLGVVYFAPVLCLLAAAGAVVSPRRTTVSAGAVIALFLFAFAQTHNVNHGGTPGMSRYALWILAAALPVAAAAARQIDARRPVVAVVTIAASVGMTWSAFRPVLDQRQSLRPSLIAAALWKGWPSADTPLPEVFVERSSGLDGRGPVPVSNPDCSKILVRGNGAESVFPFPCEPLLAPPACAAADALCYVDRGRFSLAPPQPGFGWAPHAERSWSVSTRELLAPIVPILGLGTKTVRLGEAHRVVTGRGVDHVWIVEGSRGTAIWAYPLPSVLPQITLRLDKPAAVTHYSASDKSPLGTERLDAGEHVVWLDSTQVTLLTVIDET